MNPLTQSKKTIIRPLLVALALACFTLLPGAQAVVTDSEGYFPGYNTAEGDWALYQLESGSSNTAIGFQALYSDTTGSGNTATGLSALMVNLIGDYNTATGYTALLLNRTGSYNTANGYHALYNNYNGNYNTALGAQALFSNTTGSLNTANGAYALNKNTNGLFNTANGYQALYSMTSGSMNIALGYRALYSMTSGTNNIALGGNAGLYLDGGSDNIYIGNLGVAPESNKIRIGKQGTQNGTFIGGISEVAVTGSQVVVNANGQLGVATSSARFKDEIKPINEGSEAILALKPVTFRYKEQIDPDRIPQFGLIAEEVEKVNPDLVVRDGNGEIYTVRYDAVNAMLLNEFLKEHRTVQELRNELAALTATVKEQAAQIQKVIAQVELSKFATGRVCSDGPLRQIGLNDQ
jgi:hypothetical protein